MKLNCVSLLLFYCLIIISGCKEQDDLIAHGYYQGSFDDQGKKLFDAISFDRDHYTEVPSGGVMNQKFPCISKGTFSIRKNAITFRPVNKDDCPYPEYFLSGDYSLTQTGTTIVFQRGTGNNCQAYNLTLISATP